MAHYRHYSQEQTRLLPVSLQQQIQPGTIEHTINYLIDHEIDLGVFETQYCNDDTGAPAIHPAILLKVILFAYSRGITSSRHIARCCEENVLFMALAADTRVFSYHPTPGRQRSLHPAPTAFGGRPFPQSD